MYNKMSIETIEEKLLKYIENHVYEDGICEMKRQNVCVYTRLPNHYVDLGFKKLLKEGRIRKIKNYTYDCSDV